MWYDENIILPNSFSKFLLALMVIEDCLKYLRYVRDFYVWSFHTADWCVWKLL